MRIHLQNIYFGKTYELDNPYVQSFRSAHKQLIMMAKIVL